MEYAIEITGLTKQFDTFKLENINLTIPKGYIVGLIGENGAGKTTTIKLILNLLHKEQGSIRIFGQNHQENEKLLKERIGVVFDECHFPEQLTPKDLNLIMKNIYANWDSQLFDQYLNQFKIPMKQIVKELSRGMKMKLSLAVALSHHPDLLILDEPTSGLDLIVRNEILDIFLDFIQDEEHSILMSSHITTDLEKVADYITFLHQGKIIFSDSKDTLLNEYAIIKCSEKDFNLIDFTDIIKYKKTPYQYEVLIKNKKSISIKYPNLTMDNASIEDLMLLHIGGNH